MFTKSTIHQTLIHDFLNASEGGGEPIYNDLAKALLILESFADSHPEAAARHRDVANHSAEEFRTAAILADAIRLGGWTQGEVEGCFFSRRVIAALDTALGVPMENRRYSPAPL
jgi:hypothetical protein